MQCIILHQLPKFQRVVWQAVPRAQELTRGKMQPAAQDAAERLDATAEKITGEIIQPVAQVCHCHDGIPTLEAVTLHSAIFMTDASIAILRVAWNQLLSIHSRRHASLLL